MQTQTMRIAAPPPRSIGLLAERKAELHLIEQGYAIVERGYYSRFGEIDLIAEKGEMLVFVEVRKRAHARFGSAMASVKSKKQRKIVMTAMRYMQMHHVRHRYARFDVISLMGKSDDDEKIEHIESAFDSGF